MQAADTGGAGNAACVAVWSVLVGCRVGASEACTVRWRSRLYCPLVHVGLAFAKPFSIQKLEPQVAFLSIASSVPLPDPWILNTWLPPFPTSMPMPATPLLPAVVGPSLACRLLPGLGDKPQPLPSGLPLAEHPI
jgi:hypothetical protein